MEELKKFLNQFLRKEQEQNQVAVQQNFTNRNERQLCIICEVSYATHAVKVCSDYVQKSFYFCSMDYAKLRFPDDLKVEDSISSSSSGFYLDYFAN